MEPVELAPTLRPLLESGEKIICIQNKVGLYRDSVRDEEHDNGTVYLTSSRIVYVDQQLPRERSVALHLSRVERWSLHSGFLYTSAKICLHIRAASSSNRIQASLSVAASPTSANWKCVICDYVNRGGGLGKCVLCGVRRQDDSPDLGIDKCRELNVLNDAEQQISCPTCTFDNHTSMERCEMCDGELRHLPPKQTDDVGGIVQHEQRMAVKLSFRAGGSSLFYAALKGALSSLLQDSGSLATVGDTQSAPVVEVWPHRERQTTAGGISTIVSAAHETGRARDVRLKSAFLDLDALTTMANEIVGMAEHIATQLNSPAASKLHKTGGGESDEDSAARVDAFRQYVLDLGIESPVTKDTAGAVFHEELARELCDYLENYVSQSGGTVALVDAYCLYNRAREFTLVYPSDFVQACGMFEKLGLGLRLREYPSGLLAIEDPGSASDALIASRIDSYVQSFGPLTANGLAAMDDCPLTLAEERLWLCERNGQLCRDESIEGVRFYSNIFVQANNNK
ncbi:Vps36-domain-containing protein [Coemansia reversa NRRL 1564]|uniref:Vacuolar protein-sorting-associated protein 36 n=1 Tax=Coemansia reversa (strain ATCC 12441 / NRRL 1564) TaxID=763665 RepID=A0A2G5BJ44_COERN|nr:Vps36-domain-containing protein [Coemansia reversa NRRL 1564]|eukprot:PIA19023.1 Vps36-domain-containing protein [Coemansia reversa NRRL 1564]